MNRINQLARRLWMTSRGFYRFHHVTPFGDFRGWVKKKGDTIRINGVGAVLSYYGIKDDGQEIEFYSVPPARE